MTPEEALFRAHLEGVPFRSGLDRKRWGFPGEPSFAWPHCILWVQCEPRFSGSERVLLRFDVMDIRQLAPNAVPWDVEKNQDVPGDKWPKGPATSRKYSIRVGTAVLFTRRATASRWPGTKLGRLHIRNGGGLLTVRSHSIWNLCIAV